MSEPNGEKWVIRRGFKAVQFYGTNNKGYVIAAVTNDPRNIKGDPVARLRKIIEEDLGWRSATPCLNAGCGGLVRYSVLDSIEVSDGHVTCSTCGSHVSGYLRYDTHGPYGIMFQEAVLLVAMAASWRTEFHVGNAVALAFTALEVFLIDIYEFQRKDRGIQAELDPMSANVWKYLRWLEGASLIGKNEAEKEEVEEQKPGHREVINKLQILRNDFVHRGKGVDTEGAIIVCEGIAQVFNALGHLLPQGEPSLGELKCIDEP